MPCPTCDHTTEALPTTRPMWWCPRCGTLIESGPAVVTRAKLVDRCREIEGLVHHSATMTAAWDNSGIAESIRPIARLRKTP